MDTGDKVFAALGALFVLCLIFAGATSENKKEVVPVSDTCYSILLENNRVLPWLEDTQTVGIYCKREV